MSFDKFLLTVESRDLSQTDRSIKRVSSFPKLVMGKGFSFLNQCFAQLQFWKSVSDSRNLLAGATAVLLETLFQNRSRAKH